MKIPHAMEKYRHAVSRCGVLPETPAAADHGPPSVTEEIPPKISWLPFCGPIRDQGAEGSCAGHGILKVFEMEHLRLTGVQLNTSERFCYNLARIIDDNPMDFIQQSGTTLAAAARVLRHYGVCDEDDWAYVAGDRSHLEIGRFLEILREARSRKIAEYRNLLRDGVNEAVLATVKQALCRRPLVCGLTAEESWFDAPDDGFLSPGGEPVGGHAVALAFYDDRLEHDGQVGWFGFVNSWSQTWGNQGIGYIAYDVFIRSLLSCYEIVL
jgi:hypothetical protein